MFIIVAVFYKQLYFFRLKSGRLVTKSLLSSPRPGGSTDGPVMAKDEGWVDDDPTVPAGWRTKEYVNKGIIEE